ncbi:SAM-dependent methyltransferase, partial [Mycobacterium sp. ITM-2017-0098]
LDIDMPSLVYAGARSPVMDYLRDQGWQVTEASRTELFTRYGRTMPAGPDDTDPLGEIVYVSATLNQ